MLQPPQKDTKGTPKDSLGGIPLGQKGDSPYPILDALGERGVELSRTTVPRLRSGNTAGSKIAERLKAAEFLEADDATKKDDLYLKIAQTGIKLRKYQEPPNGDKFNSSGFTEELANSFNMDTQIFRKLIRSMRADMVYGQNHDPNSVFSQSFKSLADKFMEVHTKPGGSTNEKTRQKLLELQEEWSGNVEDFYKKMYEKILPRAIGMWTPYEMEAFFEFYTSRKASGSKLTPFDKLILKARNQKRGEADLVKRLRDATGIPIEPMSMYSHRSVLLDAKA